MFMPTYSKYAKDSGLHFGRKGDISPPEDMLANLGHAIYVAELNKRIPAIFQLLKIDLKP